LKNYLLIIRPFNCIFVGLAVLAAAILNKHGLDYSVVFFAVTSAMFIAAGGYVINDFYDLPIDMVNKPRRVLPSGRISPEKAYIYAMFLFVFGLSLSYFTGVAAAIALAIFNSLILYYYAKRLKNVVLIGNLLVSYSAASTFLFGAIVTNNLRRMLPIIVYTGIYTFVREIIKDAEDVKGDKKFGIASLATIFGEKTAVTLSLIPAAFLIVMIYAGYYHSFLNAPGFYALISAYSLPVILIYISIYLKLSIVRLRMAASLMKLHMLILFVIYFLTI
jgi:geranylgeranylglycerol-phosphate geranylgeranyltransferase